MVIKWKKTHRADRILLMNSWQVICSSVIKKNALMVSQLSKNEIFLPFSVLIKYTNFWLEKTTNL